MTKKILCRLTIAIAIVNSLSMSLEQIPAGDYYYIAKQENRDSLLLRKSGFTVIGWSKTHSPSCFRGIVKGNKIFNVTQAFPPYDPASEWKYTEGEVYNLDNYRIVSKINNKEQKYLLTCVRIFWR